MLTLVPAANADEARVVTSSSEKVKLSISGQFTRDIVYLDDGGSARVRHQDSNYTSSRFRLHANSRISSDLKVGGLAEIAIDDNRNSLSNATAFGGRSGDDLQTRKAELIFDHANFGKVSMGAGEMAADGIMETETHGVYAALPIGAALQASAAQFRQGGNGNLSGITLSDVFPDFDFTGRQTRIRYDTPVLGGFMLSASHSDDTSVELALRYGATILDTQIRAGVGYSDSGAGVLDGNYYGGGISGTHASGFGATFGIGRLNEKGSAATPAGEDAFLVTSQLHYGRRFLTLGKTSLVGEYLHTEHAPADGDVGKVWAVVLQQDIDAAAMQVYLRYANHELERDGLDVEDIDIVALGTRVKF